ncbi:hypothetical protein JXJ21_20215 [candidate division KSB1 bacterium]|nr:hypothetical protein [candidate division KSB1 bacterium]
MKCIYPNRETLIEAYVTGRLSTEEKEAFDEHCFNCDICFDELMLREEIVNVIQAETDVIFADYLNQQHTRKSGLFQSFVNKFSTDRATQRIRWALAGVSVAAIAVILFFLLRSQRTHPPILPLAETRIAATDSQGKLPADPSFQPLPDSAKPDGRQELTRPAKPVQIEDQLKPDVDRIRNMPDPEQRPEELLAANFTPLPYLESQCDDHHRSASIIIESPKSGARVESPITFAWEHIDEEMVALSILDNRGDVVFSARPDSNQFICSEKLVPGRYYWRLENGEDLIYLGKFFVGKK